MYFDDLGIYGWDSIEPLILSAILSDLSVLLIGDIGTNKTEGAKTIARLFSSLVSSFGTTKSQP